MKARKCKQSECTEVLSKLNTTGLCEFHQRRERYLRRRERVQAITREERQQHAEEMARLQAQAIDRYNAERNLPKPIYLGIPQGQVSERHAMRRGPGVRYDYLECRR